jgi:hypothetical protein
MSIIPTIGRYIKYRKIVSIIVEGAAQNSTRVMYDWDFITEESANELTLYKTHGLSNAPLALWLRGLPSISVIHNALINIKFRRPLDRWFSHLGSGRIKALLKIA